MKRYFACCSVLCVALTVSIGCSSGGGGAGGSGGASAATGGKGSGGASASGGATGSGGAVASGGSGGGFTATGGRASGGSGGAGTGGAPGTGGGNGGTAATAFVCPSGPFAAPSLTGLTVTRVAGAPPMDAFNNNRNNFSVVEGPVWVGDALYFTEIGSGNNPPPARILKLTGGGVVSVALDNAGANGLLVDPTGALLGGNHKDGAITRFTLPALAATPVVASFGGQRFNSPNDLTLRADGNLYFSDPDYQAPAPRPQSANRLYRLAPGTTVATVIDANRTEPNGVTLSPDGNTLYLTAADGLYRYAVAVDGAVGTGTKIVPSIGAGDGMAIDCAGNLYVASNATVVVVSPSGVVLGTISVPGVQATTNAAFGGADHKTLYITALGSGTQSGLFTVTMNVPGYPY